MRNSNTRHESAVVLSAVALLLLAVAQGAAAGAPARDRTLDGTRLGGVALGATGAQVRAAWSDRFGRCRSCRRTTWYFNERPFRPEGTGVEFRAGRAVALFTLWSPERWRTREGLALGDDVARVTEVYGALTRVACDGYAALTLPRGDATVAFHVVGDEVWGFGLTARGVPVCR